MKITLTNQDILTSFGITNPMVISIVGSGGKTTLMYRLAKELTHKNKQVISTTTTKIYPPKSAQSPKLIIKTKIRAEDFLPLLEHYRHITIAESKNQEGKLIGIQPELIDRLNIKLIKPRKLDYILVEADGSRGKSLKAYRSGAWIPASAGMTPALQKQRPNTIPQSAIINPKCMVEPVIPSSTNLCILVLGWDILGKPLNNRYVHRAQLLSRLINVKINTLISVPILIKSLCIEGGYLSRIPKTCRLIVLINKADFEADKRRLNQFCHRLLKESPRPIDRIVIGELKGSR